MQEAVTFKGEPIHLMFHLHIKNDFFISSCKIFSYAYTSKRSCKMSCMSLSSRQMSFSVNNRILRYEFDRMFFSFAEFDNSSFSNFQLFVVHILVDLRIGRCAYSIWLLDLTFFFKFESFIFLGCRRCIIGTN